MPLRSYNRLPDVPAGYPLESNGRSWFSVIVPIARTNLVTNPSFETNTTSWTNVGGTIARSAAQQYHGAYSLAVTPSAGQLDGASYDIALTSGTTYAYSAKVRGAAGVKYQLAIYTTGGTQLVKRSFTGTGRWQWIWLYYTETSSTTRRLYVIKDINTSTATFYVDGVQVEALAAGETVSTYLDGDQQGLVPNQFPVPYGWNGTPHASTSYRTVLARNGGMVKPLSLYGFLLTGIIGLGMAGVAPVSTDYALLDGGQYLYTRKPSRTFTLTGRIQARTMAELDRKRGDLAAALDRDVIGLDQPLTLLYQQYDQSDRATSDVARLNAVYTGGLQGAVDNHFAETIPISFTTYLPLVSDAEAGAGLTVQTSVANANDILQRSAAGAWSAMGTGGNGAVDALVRGQDGSIYAGGLFSSMGGVANTNRIARWNGSAWNAMGTGVTLGNFVFALAVGPDGSIYAGGSFTQMGGVANTAGIAKWNGSAWSALGTGVTAGTGVNALVIGIDGSLYAGGTFTQMGGVANTNRIAKWNGSAWSALSTGMNGDVFALTRDAAGNIYAGGAFTTSGGVTTNSVTKWNGTAFTALSTGMNFQVLSLAVGLDQRLYAGGDFTTAGGVSASHIAVWNGSAWAPLGSGLDNAAYSLVVDQAGILHISGSFSTAGGFTFPDRYVRWNGAAYLPTDVDLPGTAIIYAVLPGGDGTLVLGFDTTGTATVAGVTTANSSGTVKGYPTLKITGPTSGTSRIYQIVNYTTGKAIYFNLTLNVGETATLVFQPDMLSFTSDFQGNIASTILPGSNESDFFLTPGANSMSFFAAASTVTGTLKWQLAYAHLSELTYS